MIPEKAKKVFKGVLFDVYQWEQKLFDGTSKTFEAIRRRPSCQIIATKEDKIILVKEEQPFNGKFITVPGGVVDEGEEPIDAAKRELKEELGMEPGEIIEWKETVGKLKVEWNTNYFIAKNCNKVSDQKLDGGEKIEEYIVSLDEFFDELEKPTFRNKELANMMLRIKLDSNKLEEFKNLLFNK